MRRKSWKFTAGTRGEAVTVFERVPGGVLYARTWDPSLRGGRGWYRKVSLGYRDQAEAKRYALEQAARLRQDRSDLLTGRVTLARVFAAYLAHRSPQKTEREQRDDQRRSEMWSRVLGGTKDPHRINRRELDGLITQRSRGELSPQGECVPEDKRRPVRARTVERDIDWLHAVCNWALSWRESDDRPLLRENPLRGFAPPSERSPRRPVASTDRYEAIRAVSDRVLMECRWSMPCTVQRSYLSELLDLAHHTGRRIAAICALRYEDVRLEPTPDTPHGAIRWPAETDKGRRETVVPMHRTVRAALLRVLAERPGIGAAYLFPCPTTPDSPVATRRARAWLLAAEQLAELPKQEGGCWHPYRRGFATSRKHLPLPDLAAAGGWKGTEALQRCYLHADPATMLQVVSGPVELRERSA